jgi:hypothetical protein
MEYAKSQVVWSKGEEKKVRRQLKRNRKQYQLPASFNLKLEERRAAKEMRRSNARLGVG